MLYKIFSNFINSIIRREYYDIYDIITYYDYRGRFNPVSAALSDVKRAPWAAYFLRKAL